MLGIITVTVIVLSTLENLVTLIMGYASTPKGSVFLGTTHHPTDYFYYLSQFAQGASRWLYARDLYTAEPIPLSFVGWFNVLLGHLFGLAGFSPQMAYGLSVIIFTILVLLFAYKVSLVVLRNRTIATTALFLFAVYHAFPALDHGAFTFNDYWNNYATPSVRLGGVPHQLFTAVLSFLLVIGTTLTLENGKLRRAFRVTTLIGLFLGSAMLASLQPALWVLVTGCLGISAVVYGLVKKSDIKQLSIFCIPAFILFLGGIAPAYYLMKLFQTEPFIQLKLWESMQYSPFTVGSFILTAGPVFLIAVLSLPWFVARRTFAGIFTVVFPFVSFVLFHSPVPRLLGITQVRFMSTLTILCVSIIAADGIHRWSAWVRTKLFHKHTVSRGLLTFVLLFAVTLVLLPSHIKTITMASQFDPINAYQYLSVSDYRFLISAGRKSRNDTDVFLIIWPYNTIFPALTGRRSFNGHTLLTIDAEKKDMEAQHFFDGSMTADAMQQLITSAHIAYVIAYTWTPILGLMPSLSPILSTPTLILYHVGK